MDKDTLKGYLADYYKDSKVTDDILTAFALVITNLETAREDMMKQLQPESATYSLSRWENDYCLENKDNYDTAYRRSIIVATMKGMNTCTIEYIKNVALSYDNGEIEVIEPTTEGDYTLIIKFTGKKGVPPNLNDFKHTIEEIIPAHMVPSYKFSYLTWDERDNYNKTWDEWDSLNLTWDDYEVYQG